MNDHDELATEQSVRADTSTQSVSAEIRRSMRELKSCMVVTMLIGIGLALIIGLALR